MPPVQCQSAIEGDTFSMLCGKPAVRHYTSITRLEAGKYILDLSMGLHPEGRVTLDLCRAHAQALCEDLLALVSPDWKLAIIHRFEDLPAPAEWKPCEKSHDSV